MPGRMVFYDVSLPLRQSKRIIHLIASSISDDELNFQTAPENISIPRLQLKDGQDAYWNRVEVPSIGVKDKDTGKVSKGAEYDLINKIALIRNFAKVTVEANESTIGANYEGFYLINTPQYGTVAPYGASNASPNDKNKFAIYSTGLTYTNLVTTFTGWNPSISTLEQKKDDLKTAVAQTTGPAAGMRTASAYLYERHIANRANVSFVVVKAKYGGTSYFYHIDLVKLDDAGQASTYHILRNFEYKITLGEIAGKGYKTLQEAIDGEASNNISYSKSTMDLMTITNSDKDRIEVEFTQKTHIKAENGTLTVKYTNGNGSYPAANEMEAVVYENDELSGVLVNSTTQDLLPVGQKYTLTGSNGTYNLSYNVKNIAIGRSTIRVYKKSGLGRQVEIVSRNAFEYQTDPKFNGKGKSGLVCSYNMPSDHQNEYIYPMDTMPVSHQTGGYSKSQNGHFYVYIKIPSDMPKSTFPLVFDFEDRNQAIYPDVNGILTTHVAGSGFDGVTDARIHYQYKLEWEAFTEQRDKNAATQGLKDVVIVAPFKFNVSVSGNTNGNLLVTNKYFDTRLSLISYSR